MAIDSSNHLKVLQIASEKVHALHSTAENIKERPRAPYPVATLFHELGRNGIKQMVSLSLPLFVCPELVVT